MNQTKTVLVAIVEFLLGKKYYANIINTRGTDRTEISSFIFCTRQEAEKHKQEPFHHCIISVDRDNILPLSQRIRRNKRKI